MIPYRPIALLAVLGAFTACSEPPACERLVSRLCAAAGAEACEQLQAHVPTDQPSCQATLDDAKALNAQLDVLVAATAARALQPAAGAEIGKEPAPAAPETTGD